MALGTAGSLLKPPTALQQLMEEINFQRTKEMRQLLKDDGGFVVLQGTTYWTDLFVRHFLFQAEHTIDSDDLLFFVRKKHIKGSSRHMPKYETEVDVFRKDSRKLPIGDPDVDWEETVYLNLVIHQFDYTLTLAICTRTSPKELQVLRRHSQRVYASPSRRKMDTKGESEEMTYPHICFMVDNFDEVFSDILVRDGEMVCVELVASDRDGSVQGVIFLGSIRYDALKKVYDARQSSLSSKVAQRMTFGLFNSRGPQTRCEFVRMKGPQGKGHAEMAVTKPKGSGVETPTSEPGFCATDMWDEWDEDSDDFLNYRHQRRLSDPSANLNNFNRYGWRTKSSNDTSIGAKARSENEGLDTLANEVSEIEAGDLRDDRPASSASDTKLSTGCTSKTANQTSSSSVVTCCNCFSPKKRWSDSASGQMSDIYCRTCDEANSPACLANITPRKYAGKPKHKNVLNIESEIEIPNSSSKKEQKKEKKTTKSSSGQKEKTKNTIIKKKDSLVASVSLNGSNNNEKKVEEYEIGDDATSLNGEISDDIVKIGILDDFDTKLMIRVQGKEELPAEQTSNDDNALIINNLNKTNQLIKNNLNIKYNIRPNNNNVRNLIKTKTMNSNKLDISNKLTTAIKHNNNDNNLIKSCIDKLYNGGTTNTSNKNRTEKFNKNNIQVVGDGDGDHNGNLNRNRGKVSNLAGLIYATLPRRKRNSQHHSMYYQKPIITVPKRTTPDGTNIYYWCEIPKKSWKELDDGAYNPLWATKGFTQTFHFWKESRRQQSTPLNAFLTYVTLPWWSIAKDLLDHRETPILTF